MKLTVNGQERVLAGVERTNSERAALSRIVLIVTGDAPGSVNHD
jgi:hypothetical protein